MIRARGFTLIEMMMVVLIVAVLAAIAQPSFTRMLAKQRTRSVASAMQLSLVKARSEAVKRNADVTLAPAAAGWDAGWQISVPAEVIEFTDPVTGVTIAGGPVNIVYNRSGRIQGGVAPAFLITSKTVATLQRCVSADPSGRPYVKETAC
jgi:type IV fimbrial biogenesis protein FimT